uniref:Cytochrome c oxidase subunit 3 n=1 Tax=Bactrothrips quadrituberculatus TaxID=1246465 RepID=A0A8E5NM89_9NEOP|nr:cytochrome c oxidase subunit III [Bactrothrips quadrituberculatus]QVD42812.1 cytochrome c oxidase subunit III [Bactrothrips quadrituberculatus]
MIYFNHPFHLVSLSPWPILASMSAFIMIFGMVDWFNNYSNFQNILGFLCILLVCFQWWRDVVREGTWQGFHTFKVFKGLQLGMILFIVSEVFFFLSFFWAFFHMSLSPDLELGLKWPPLGIIFFNPIEIPLLNTMILLLSGLTVTWAHYSILLGKKKELMLSLFLTCMLGVYFSCIQAYEYMESFFCISDSVFGSTFFVMTGFHGIHVLIGTLFLFVNFFRSINNHFSNNHHFGFEAAAWYWHFVDVVWLFLYLFVYLIGG